MASELMKTITTNYFLDIVRNGTLQDFISCLVEFAKNKRFAKTSYDFYRYEECLTDPSTQIKCSRAPQAMRCKNQ